MEHIDSTTIGHVDIALRIAGYNFKKQHVETILQVIRAVSDSEGNVSVKDIAKIEDMMQRKYQIKDINDAESE